MFWTTFIGLLCIIRASGTAGHHDAEIDTFPRAAFIRVFSEAPPKVPWATTAGKDGQGKPIQQRMTSTQPPILPTPSDMTVIKKLQNVVYEQNQEIDDLKSALTRLKTEKNKWKDLAITLSRSISPKSTDPLGRVRRSPSTSVQEPPWRQPETHDVLSHERSPPPQLWRPPKHTDQSK